MQNMKNSLIVFLILVVGHMYGQDLNNNKIKGYRGIWFELNQKYDFGDKYSGALGTYTAKHVPLAIYAPEVDMTFFVYGGTIDTDARHLLCMIGSYHHQTGLVSKPTVVCDKNGVDDPHDNPSLLIDDDGFIWVFVSGRGNLRPGYKYRSLEPYRIEEFTLIREEEMTYPQPRMTDQGIFHFFTKYTGVRQLNFERSRDGEDWTEDILLAAIPDKEGEKSGHYQTSNVFDGKKLATFFNRHLDGHPDARTDLFYVQSVDFGDTWTTVDGTRLQLPLTEKTSPARVVAYSAMDKNVYMKDMDFDDSGNPICLYIRSNGHVPGPGSAPYEWCITRWTGEEWLTTVVTRSDHNYDMGSLFINEGNWKIIGPTEPGPQKWGVGGELAIWESNDQGRSWIKSLTLTEGSERSHSYVRRSENHMAPFCFFWADGHSHNFSKSELYFGDFEGKIWKLPYNMTNDFEKPIPIKNPL